MEIKLTPQSYKMVEKDYEVLRGYAAHRKGARQAFRRALPPGDSELVREGIIKRPVFTESECGDMCRKFEAGDCDGFDRDLIVGLLGRILSPEMDREIVAYFESEYAPIKGGFLKARPGERLDVSDGWHCDAGPSKFLRIMAYFTGSEKDGANTFFSDRRTTNEMKEVGYVFCELRYRLLDLEPLADALGLQKPAVVAMDIEPGDVIVFDAPNLMHRRSVPKSAPRYVMTATLIPSITPWREVTDIGNLPMSLETESFPHLPGYAAG